MRSATIEPVTLVAHAWTPSDAIESFQVKVSVDDPNLLVLRYCVQGDISRIRLVSEGSVSPGRADGLWKHTCCEVFLRPVDASGYYELNFSPARQWAAYQFDSYRRGMRPWPLSGEPAIAVQRQPDRLELDAAVPLPWSAAATPRLRIALCGVIEEDSGRLCYWSARHPPGKPDFHHPDAFGLELEPRVGK